MSAITIDKETHVRNLKNLRNEYVRDFGYDAVMNTQTNAKKYSRQEYIETYAKNIHFWESRIPDIEIDRGMNMDLIAKHAICTNAVQNLTKELKEKGILNEVKEVAKLLP